ncbi:MAG: sodium:alanine symporter family protein [Shimia sp.]|uniref:alanine/glycine:cation symporter family protein n=1 Tax=Shimia sp. TaxID=1954381 RepID=UPI0019F0EA97|nr:sodium:alanine symporter family protein [Shimia sp.]MBE1291983.1 amino acid carrier protein [Paracoccaceae bacterium]MBO6899406.1 sodium:alanine symporter family protein [Shimia sp.]
MELLNSVVGWVNGVVWGPPMLILILGVGAFMQISLKLMPILRMPHGFKLLAKGRQGTGEGQISPFNALMTALSATIGTGNIAGVATAVFLGGPGALFWMWMTALVGMATKYSEAVLAVKYRERDSKGNYVGGPMYYIKNGLGQKWAWLGAAFAIFGAIAAFGIGNGVQANGVAQVLEANFGFNTSVTGIVLMVLTGAVILGGITRIGAVAGALVPFMAVTYVAIGLIVLMLNADQIGHALNLVFTHAFTPSAAEGGFAGAAVWAAIRFGVARGVFSNEAGLGSAPIAHAAAETKGPVNQGLIAMLGTFIDTIIVCSITGLAIITSGVLTSGESGAALTSLAFETTLPGFGGSMIAIALSIFAFTTIIGWSYYGEKCVGYLMGAKVLMGYRVLWIAMIYFGATADLGFIWLLADTLNAMMALPNLIAIALLSPVVVKVTQEFFASNGATEEPGSSKSPAE